MASVREAGDESAQTMAWMQLMDVTRMHVGWAYLVLAIQCSGCGHVFSVTPIEMLGAT